MRELFRWQLTGDALKIASWVLAYLMLSKAMFVPFIGLEIGFSAGFVALVFLLTPLFGLSGAVMAYAFNYLLYWVAIYAATRHHLHHNISRVR
jgi:PST family polysaccharide transporter